MSNTITLWYSEISENLSSDPYRSLLDESELSRAKQFKHNSQQSKYIFTRGLLRTLLSEMLGEKPQSIRLATGQHGKPYCLDYPELAFNLSHTANHVLIGAASNCQLGVDIELVKPRASLHGLVGKCFSQTEVAHWQQTPEQDKLAEFYRFWTAKEAFVKATGRGISLGLQYCELNPANPDSFLNIPTEYGAAEQWSVHRLHVNPDLSAAVVVDLPRLTPHKTQMTRM